MLQAHMKEKKPNIIKKIKSSSEIYSGTSNKRPISDLIIRKRKELLKQVCISLSFTRALKFALSTSKWTLPDRELLLEHLSTLQQQICAFNHNMQVIAVLASTIDSSFYSKIANIGKEIDKTGTEAVKAIDHIDNYKLAHALDTISERLNFLVETIVKVVKSESK